MNARIAMGGALAAIALSACGGGADTPAASTKTTSTTSTTSTPSTPTMGAGDAAACKGYARVMKQGNEAIKSIGEESMSTFVISLAFKSIAEGIEKGTVAATYPDLVTAFKGAATGARSAMATSDAFTEGNLDLVPDLTVIYENTQKAADICNIVDPGGNYVAIVNPK